MISYKAMKAKKILLLPVGVGLAHVGRCIMLGRELRRRGHNVVIASGPEGKAVILKEGLTHRDIFDFSREVVREIRRLNPFFLTAEKVKALVESELVLFKAERPDLVVSDLRATARISTLVYGVPYVFITNTDTTRFYDYSRARFTIPSYWGRHLPEKLLNLFETRTGQRLTWRIMAGFTAVIPLPILFHFNRVCRFYKLPMLLSIFDIPMGDITILADAPFFRPIKKLPGTVFQVGPIFWDGGRRLSAWRNSFRPNGKPVIYVTASGTGDPKIFRLLLSYLSGGPWVVIGTTGNTMSVGEVSDFSMPQFFITDFLPGQWTLSKSNLAIFPGGNSTAYQALSFGVPQIAVPLNIDQEDNANQLVRLGTALKLDPYRLTKEKFLTTVEQVLSDDSFKKRTSKFAEILREYNGVVHATNIIEGFLLVHEK